MHDSGTSDHPYEVSEYSEKNKVEAKMKVAVSPSFSHGLVVTTSWLLRYGRTRMRGKSWQDFQARFSRLHW